MATQLLPAYHSWAATRTGWVFPGCKRTAAELSFLGECTSVDKKTLLRDAAEHRPHCLFSVGSTSQSHLLRAQQASTSTLSARCNAPVSSAGLPLLGGTEPVFSPGKNTSGSEVHVHSYSILALDSEWVLVLQKVVGREIAWDEAPWGRPWCICTWPGWGWQAGAQFSTPAASSPFCIPLPAWQEGTMPSITGDTTGVHTVTCRVTPPLKPDLPALSTLPHPQAAAGSAPSAAVALLIQSAYRFPLGIQLTSIMLESYSQFAS